MPPRVPRDLFDPQQAELISRLLPTLTLAQLQWLGSHVEAAVRELRPDGPAATVLYGSQTGNCEAVAQALTRRLQAEGVRVAASSIDRFEPRELSAVEVLLAVVSTHGEGEPPDSAVALHAFLQRPHGPRLDGVRFAVLELGDSSYEQFCRTGEDFDRRLAQLGGERLIPLVRCDVAYEAPAQAWMSEVTRLLCAGARGPAAAAAAPAPPADAASAFGRGRPFAAEVVENVNLNGPGSAKETRHIELALTGSGLAYEPGDALGVYPRNDPALVEQLIAEMRWSPEAPVPSPSGAGTRALREVLLEEVEIARLTPGVLGRLADLSRDGLSELVARGQGAALREYVAGRDLVDAVRDFGLRGSAPAELVPMLKRLAPRLYSIASSQRSTPGEVHLTVRVVRYESHGRRRTGVASGHMAQRVAPGDTLPVYVQRNPSFRLPSDPQTPVIMIGPGTGVAPYRGFLQERARSASPGQAWLFFGEARFKTDFLYQTEWQRWLDTGVLTRLDVAFSRDGPHKVYVQDRLREHGRQVFAWIEAGAYVYVCGDRTRMAADVHGALVEICAWHGGMSPDDAAAYVAALQRDKRYQRDVY